MRAVISEEMRVIDIRETVRESKFDPETIGKPPSSLLGISLPLLDMWKQWFGVELVVWQYRKGESCFCTAASLEEICASK